MLIDGRFMNGLYTNTSSKMDFVENGLRNLVQDDMDVFIASAFFTETDVIDLFVDKGCHVKIVVRLGFPTSPDALEYLLKNKNIEARFYTSHSFHPKIYIFGDKTSLVGSANLTSAAIRTNQEVVLEVESDDERFEGISQLFSGYWDEAVVLTDEAIASYRKIYDRYKQASDLINQFDDDVVDQFGDQSFSNIDRDKKKGSKKSIFIDSYSKSYQESVSAFNKIQDVYITKNRKVDESSIPLRLEIDSFFSFVRERYATHELWKEQSLGWNSNKSSLLDSLVDEWLVVRWDHFEDRIVNINYPLISRVFSTAEAIDESTYGEVVDALCVLHSFHDRLRFYKGGLETLKQNFMSSNDLNKVKHSLKHLLHGKGNAVTRMSDCIYSDEYKLNEFGQANVQELIGWVNRDGLPVINGRSTKVLRYFGFNVRQL